MRRIIVALWLIGSSACFVEEPQPRPPDAGPADTGVDAGVSCVTDPSICLQGQFCDEGTDTCKPNVECKITSDCFPPDRCIDERCGAAPATCMPGQCLSNERCTPSGFCVRALDDTGRIRPRCNSSSDCSLGVQCIDGACQACNSAERPCPAPFVCGADGVCDEPVTCQGGADCWPGHNCVDNACVRSVSGCEADEDNNTSGGADELLERTQTGLSICGEDVDWYRFDLDAFAGARLVITTTTTPWATLPELDVRVTDGAGADVAATGALESAGRTIIEVPGIDEARAVFVEVQANTSAIYSIDLEKTEDRCAGDALDIYGDEDPATAPFVLPGRVDPSNLRACIKGRLDPSGRTVFEELDHLRLIIGANDQIELQAEILSISGTELETSISNEAGAVLTSTIVTAAAPRSISLPRAANDSTWLWRARTDNAPELGADYRLRFNRETGQRFVACQAATEITATETFSFDAASDLGEANDRCLGNNSSRADRIFFVSPPRVPTLLRATIRPTLTSTDTHVAVGLLGNCLDDTSLLQCDASPITNLGASFEYVVTSTQPLYIYASTDVPNTTAELSVSFDEAGNFSCIGGRSEPILSSGSRPVSTIEATNTAELTTSNVCGVIGDGAGPDRFYSLALSQTDRAVLELTGDIGGMLWVGTNCERMTETCTSSSTVDDRVSPARLVLEPQQSTTYVIAVDGLRSEHAGQYDLRAVLNPECVADGECLAGNRCDDYICANAPANDQCPGEVLALGAGAVTGVGSTGAAADEYDSETCTGGQGGDDVVFQLTLPTAVSSLRARVINATWDAMLYVRGNLCDTRAAEIACQDDEDFAAGLLLPDLTIDNLAAGTYYFIVDTYVPFGGTSDGGPFELEISVVP